MVWGKLLSALTQLQNVGNGKTVDVSKIHDSMNESFVSLSKTTSGEIAKLMNDLSGMLTSSFKNLDTIVNKDVGKTLSHTTDILSKNLNTTISDINRQTSHFTKVMGESFTAIPYKLYTNIPEESSSKKRSAHLSDEVFKRTDNNISARRNAVKKQLDYYKQ